MIVDEPGFWLAVFQIIWIDVFTHQGSISTLSATLAGGYVSHVMTAYGTTKS